MAAYLVRRSAHRRPLVSERSVQRSPAPPSQPAAPAYVRQGDESSIEVSSAVMLFADLVSKQQMASKSKHREVPETDAVRVLSRSTPLQGLELPSGVTTTSLFGAQRSKEYEIAGPYDRAD